MCVFSSVICFGCTPFSFFQILFLFFPEASIILFLNYKSQGTHRDESESHNEESTNMTKSTSE
eukprot:m.68791 g.68791  ORF g.68791 m.68791 type:complete len:63 (-) comp12793_c0_seq1:42-230(-)